MSVEWRCFFRLPAKLDLRQQRKMRSTERSDIYIVLPEERLGFKFRRCKTLELKTMIKKLEKNGLEFWVKKIGLGRYSGDLADDLKVIKQSVRMLDDKKFSRVHKYFSSLTLDEFSGLCVRVDKVRTMIPTTFFCDMEQTDISFSLTGVENWRSICIEGLEKNVLAAKSVYLEKLANIGQKVEHIGGYPGFLCSRLQAVEGTKAHSTMEKESKDKNDDANLGKLVNISISAEQLRIQVEFPEEKTEESATIWMTSGSTIDAFIAEVTKHCRRVEGVSSNRLKLLLPAIGAGKDREFYLSEVDSKYLTLGSLLKQSNSIVRIVIEPKEMTPDFR